MAVTILLFGQLGDITGKKSIILEEVNDTDELISRLHTLYPDLARIKYVIAVDLKIVAGKTSLQNNNTVALLPPYAGG